MTIPAPLAPLIFPLHGARLIEASAGTGKTWTIAALYVRLILGHGDAEAEFGRPLLPPEILVVTFTEAATKELRDRIRRRLYEAARWFRAAQNDVPPEPMQADAFLQSLIDSYPEAQRAGCARRLEIAVEWMDEAAIYTIHGWCNRMLRQHAFDSGSLFNLELEAEDAELLHEAARDYWRRFFYPLDESACLAVGKLAAGPPALLAMLKPLLAVSDARVIPNSNPPAAETVEPQILLQQWGNWEIQRRRLEGQARRSWAEKRAEIEGNLREASGQGRLDGRSYPPKSFEARLQAVADWAESDAECKREWLAGFAQSRFKMNKKFQDQPPQHAAFTSLDLWADHLEQERGFNQDVLRHAALWVQGRYAEEKQRRARMDFDDLLAHLDQALRRPGGERLAEVMRRQYPVALIDEFQDTDPLQYRIFAAVYSSACGNEGGPHSQGLFMIGDPKQAIYSFRGADIFTYLQARDATRGRHYTLARNFRSTPDLVAALNRVFEHAEAQAGGAFLFKPEEGENPLPYRAVEAQGRAEHWLIEGQVATALTLWHWAAETALGLGEYRKTLAAACAGEIVRWLSLADRNQAGFATPAGFMPLKPADIAILVRDRSEAAAIRNALAARQIRSVYLSGRDSVFTSPEAADLLYWLKACAEPEHDRRLRAALGTATLQLSYAELDRLNSDELRWEAEVERFRGYRTLWRYQGVLPMLRRLLADFGVPARLLNSADGERSLTNLLHLAELLQSAAVELDGEQALIRYLAEALADPGNPGDAHLLRLESDADLIKVVTIHKSKGLEYPLVFLPFVCAFREISGTNSSAFRYHDAQGQLQIDLGKTEAARESAERERLQEDLRLLYVALTRARHACWLGIAPVKSGNAKECQLHKSALGHVLAGGRPISAAELGAKLHALKGDCAAIAILPLPVPDNAVYAPSLVELPLEAARDYVRHAMQRWWIASYSALKLATADYDAISDRAAEAPDTPRQSNLLEAVDAPERAAITFPVRGAATLHPFPRGAQPGTFLHGLLEWAAREGFDRVAADARLREDAIARRCQRRGWTTWIAPLDAWLTAMLSTPLALPDGAVALQSLDNAAYQPELEFWFAADAVDTLELDRLVTHHVFPGLARPGLAADQLNGMLKGFIDLVFEWRGRYYVADYKSNWLGTDDSAYTADAMRAEMLAKRYDLQATLYLLALHRQLRARLGKAYDYDSHVGGSVYLFLRGIAGPAGGVQVDKPPRALIEALDALFTGAG
ncbi:MAG: exodeoxyribonuclease V subunit beta [Methylococcaceae bacterium]|nr:MAG: exodeoxyribonuclease V subunit beta [Methylococcaceae bacterium]